MGASPAETTDIAEPIRRAVSPSHQRPLPLRLVPLPDCWVCLCGCLLVRRRTCDGQNSTASRSVKLVTGQHLALVDDVAADAMAHFVIPGAAGHEVGATPLDSRSLRILLRTPPLPLIITRFRSDARRKLAQPAVLAGMRSALDNT
jgi:hypothetical protein